MLETSFLDTENKAANFYQQFKSVKTDISQHIFGLTALVKAGSARRFIKNVQPNGLQNNELSLRLSYESTLFNELSYQYKLAKQALRDTLHETSFIDFATESEHAISTKLSSKSIQNNLSFSIRDRDIDPFFLKLTNQKSRYFNSALTDSNYSNNQSILIENKFRYKAYNNALNFNFNYRTGSELTAKQELVYQQVTAGFGNYRKEGDTFIPDNKGDYLRFVLPSNEFEPVTKLNVLMQFKFNPSLAKFEEAFYKNFLNQFSFNTSLNLLEESRSEDRSQLYLLNPSSLLSNESANASLQFYQYIYYRPNNPNFNFEIAYQNRQNVTNRFVNDVSGENNRSRNFEWQLKFNYRFSEGFRFSSAIQLSRQNKSVSSDSTLNRKIDANQIKQTITYYPFKSISIIDEISFGQESNNIDLSFIRIRQITNSTSINYRIGDKGSLRAKFEFSEVNDIENPNNIALPYEMANGRQIGINREWEFNAIYRLSSNFNLDFNYSGRKNALDPDIITILRMELRLLF